MATKMEDTPNGVLISRITGVGRRHRKPRHGVLVPYDDPILLLETLIRQAELARKDVGMVVKERGPVV